jgi:sugar/nucleoside kinase (ribokinase family)
LEHLPEAAQLDPVARRPKMVVIKQGEHGALLVDPETTFKAPAYPLQEVFDQTGAGDAFAGGFMAHVARTGDLGFPNLRRAMIYGSAMGSLAVKRSASSASSNHDAGGARRSKRSATSCTFRWMVRNDQGRSLRRGGGQTRYR